VYRRVAGYSKLFLSRSGFGETDVVIVDSHGVRDGEPEMGAHDMIHSVLVLVGLSDSVWRTMVVLQGMTNL